MTDLSLLRENPTILRAACARKHLTVDIDAIGALDTDYLFLQRTAQSLNEARNTLSKRVAGIKDKRSPEFAALVAEGKRLGSDLKATEAQLTDLEPQWRAALHTIPNVPHESVPDGATPDDNQVVGHWRPPVLSDEAQEDQRRVAAYDHMVRVVASFDPPYDPRELFEWGWQRVEGRTVRGVIRRWIVKWVVCRLLS